MRVHDDAQTLELLEVAVHGRYGHVGGLALDLRRELLGGSMAGSLEQGSNEQTSWGGDATTAGTQPCEHTFDFLI